MRKQSFLRLILIAFSLSCLASISYALPPKTITVSGSVTDSFTRSPISGAAVSTAISGVSFKTVTGNLGKYSLNISFDKKPILIILVASKNGYLPSVKLVDNIQPNKSYTANFSLIDISPPSRPIVTDDGSYTNQITSLHASWSSQDPESGIKQYYYSIGTSKGADNTLRMTSAGSNVRNSAVRDHCV